MNDKAGMRFIPEEAEDLKHALIIALQKAGFKFAEDLSKEK